MTHGRPRTSFWRFALLVGLVAVAAACAGTPADEVAEIPTPAGDPATPEAVEPASDEPASELSGTIRLYSSVTQETIDAVLDVYAAHQPGVDVELFRAPTGELTARLAAEQREGQIRADVLWLTDPLSMQAYDAQGLLREWTPPHADAVPPEHRGERFWGTRLLNLVIVHQAGLEEPPTSWQDLADGRWDEPVALPDPGFAGSAFGALAYFALEPDFGIDYYRALADTGAVQVQAPGDVVTGVAEGRYAAGITLDNTARTAVDDGSPIEMVVPEPGAIAVYSPIAVVDGTEEPQLAESFADATLTVEAQEAIAETGWQPIRDDVDWPHGGPTVTADWAAAFDQQEELLDQYRSVVGG